MARKIGESIKGPGRARLGIWTQGRSEGDYAQITIEDDISGTTICTFDLDKEAFADLLSNRSAKGHFILRPEMAGKRFEHKTEDVTVKTPSLYDRETLAAAAEEALKPYEVDGWMANRSDAMNVNKRVRYGDGELVQRVSFFRWVEITQDEEK